MPEWRSWVPGVGSSNQLESMDVEELDLEARDLETELNLLERRLQKMDSEFEELVKKGRQASGQKQRRLKRKAKSKQREYDQKEAEWQETLEEYITLLSIKNAKERMESGRESSIRELPKEEVQEFMQSARRELHERNQETEWIKSKGSEIDHVLGAVQEDFGLTEEEDQIDELFEAGADEEVSSDVPSLSELSDEEDDEVASGVDF